VYAVSISMDEESFTGMMNIGVRPTVDGKKRVIEVNIFDFNRDIYGKKLVIRLEKFLRGEVKFNGLDELKAQLNADRTQAMLVFMP
ncbi:MAG: riboflavin kinase, partial [Sediminibacterium sp.]|nr:riboflavin kinase [Sediminibacterium sp.]